MTSEWEGTIPFANPAGAGKTPTAGWGKAVFDAKNMADNAGATKIRKRGTPGQSCDI